MPEEMYDLSESGAVVAEHVPDSAKEFFADMPEGIRDLASLGIGYGAGFMANKLGGAVVKPFKMLDKTNTAAVLLEEHALAERVLSEKILESHTKKPNMAIAEVIEDKTGITWEKAQNAKESNKNYKLPKFDHEEYFIGGRYYTHHAFEQMSKRELRPIMIEDAVKNGIKMPGNSANEVMYYNPKNGIIVILQQEGEGVVTAMRVSKPPAITKGKK